MYGEFFDIPTPDELVFISSFSGGEVFRSGVTYRRGYGKVFYFSPGDEIFPVYHHPDVQRVIANGVGWARPERAREPYVVTPMYLTGEFDRPVILFSGGKDSTLLVHLAVKAFAPAPVPFPLLHVDTGHNYPEVIRFRDDLVAKLGLRLHVAHVQDWIDDGRLIERPDGTRNPLQTQPLLDSINEHRFDAVFGGESLGAAPVAGRDRHEPGPGGVCRLDDRQLGDAGRAQDADAERPGGGRSGARHGVFRSTSRRLSALVRTSETGPSPVGASSRMVSCSRVYQPS